MGQGRKALIHKPLEPAGRFFAYFALETLETSVPLGFYWLPMDSIHFLGAVM